MGEEFPGAPDAGLDLVEDEKEPVLVAELPQRAQAARRDRADAALALDRFDHDGRGLGRDRRLQRLVVVEGDLIEALDLGAEALEIFLLAAGRDGRERASVERALEGDDAEAVRLSVRRMVLARHLDGGLVRLRPGIREEHDVGERVVDEPLSEALALGDLVEVGRVPELLRLLGERADEMRMGVTQGIHGDAGAEIEISLAASRDEPGPLASFEGKVGPRIGRQQRRSHGSVSNNGPKVAALRSKTKAPPLWRAALVEY